MGMNASRSIGVLLLFVASPAAAVPVLTLLESTRTVFVGELNAGIPAPTESGTTSALGN